jgi:hypothetical protein
MMRSNVFIVILAIVTSFLVTGDAIADDRTDELVIAYGALGRDLDASEIVAIKRATRSCTLLENRKFPAATINALGQVLVHSNIDPKFQETCLDALYERIGIDVAADGYAELEDTVSLRQHKEQQFGSFGVLMQGSLQYHGTNFVDTARSRIGLPVQKERFKRLSGAFLQGDWPSLWPRALALVPARYPASPTLRAKLMELVREDQWARSGDWKAAHRGQSRDEAMQRADAESLPVVRAILARGGYPDAGQIGRNGVTALFILVQHASEDVDLMKRALELATPLYRTGDLPPVYFALLTDRVHVLLHEEQIYGSQSGRDKKGNFVYPISSPIDVNQRRAAMFIAPLKPEFMEMQRWPNSE